MEKNTVLAEHAATQLRYQLAGVGCQIYLGLCALGSENAGIGFCAAGVGLLFTLYAIIDCVRVWNILSKERDLTKYGLQCPPGFNPDICFSKNPTTRSPRKGRSMV